MRGAGRVFLPPDSTMYHCAISYRGQEIRWSSKSRSKAEAWQQIHDKLAALGQGKVLESARTKLRFGTLADDYLKSQAILGPRTKRQAEERLVHLRKFFGDDFVSDITAGRIRAFADVRRSEVNPRTKQPFSSGTINRDLAALSGMLSLARRSDLILTKPEISWLPKSQPRQGFFEHEQYVAIRRFLPSDYRDVLDFGYQTGWRRSEILTLEWRDVDLKSSMIRLRPERSKNREGRALPLNTALRLLMGRRKKARLLSCPFVFHHDGQRIGDWRKSWWKACEKAGLKGKLFHDLRRTVVRNLVRAGVSEAVAMKMTGHKTRAVFDRYNITSERDLQNASAALGEYLNRQSRAKK